MQNPKHFTLSHIRLLQSLKRQPNRKLKLQEFFGKSYTLALNDNYSNFLRQLGVKSTVRLKALESKPTVSLSKVDDNYILTTTYKDGKCNRVKFKDGIQFQRRRPDGRLSDSIIDIVGDALVETQTIEGKKVITVREFSKEALLVLMEVDDIKCSRSYLPTTSKHSIQTETSRRYSMQQLEFDTPAPVTPEVGSISQVEEYEERKSDIDDKICY